MWPSAKPSPARGKVQHQQFTTALASALHPARQGTDMYDNEYGPWKQKQDVMADQVLGHTLVLQPERMLVQPVGLAG